MTQFRLSRQQPGQTLTKFHVLDSANSIVGIITVPNAQVFDLEKHWLGAPAPARVAAGNKQGAAIDAMVTAAKRHGAPTRAAILRGCR